ncbi:MULTISPECIES: XRE family transcriptional regulator [unclassified Streptomyces]|uniref:helix-turn-helix domain-containing protein n=1 Tax=Streptomycetaceae TaxID=2062 RepID=UPI002E791666|nr:MULTISPECIES: XRE family transcriptional regulator [unclassified Streptomyces]MED7952771.1 XRE family transcriptional regulator [Streptomyces sp. BE303]MEE1825631.1 XRE family transcriptional regulator [Streptomyces sp. BE20]
MGIETAADERLAGRLAELRVERGWTLEELARQADVSRSTLSRVERAEVSPTAALLGRLCAVYGRTMSRLLAEVESAPARLVRADEQWVWRDEATGFVRRSVSPPHGSLRAEIVEGRLPAGADIAYDRPCALGVEHHLWLLEGRLDLTVDGEAQPLAAGDCLRFVAETTRFRCPGPEDARYALVVVVP